MLTFLGLVVVYQSILWAMNVVAGANLTMANIRAMPHPPEMTAASVEKMAKFYGWFTIIHGYGVSLAALVAGVWMIMGCFR